MNDIRSKWIEAGECFADLSRQFHARYQERAEEVEEADSERLQSAVGNVLEAVDGVMVAAGKTIRDPALREDTERAAGALREALMVTFTDAIAEIEAASERLRQGLRNIPPLEDDPASGHV
jgi:hypothetical protein